MARFWVFCLLVHFVSGYKYLVYNPRLTKSHVIFMNKLVKVLVDNGHEVVGFYECLCETINLEDFV